LQKGRAALGVSGEVGAAVKVSVSVPVLQVTQPTVTVSVEAGAKASVESIQGKAQFATEATLVKNGQISISGFENKSALSLSVPETGTKIGGGSTLTLLGASDTIPLLGPAGIVVGGELTLNTQEASAALSSFEPAITEIGQDIQRLLGLDFLLGKPAAQKTSSTQ
jgi:hypothetical protein